MNTYNTPSELLTQLLDGELGSVHEEHLFSVLATDKELQLEMQNMLSIRESIRGDVEAFTPPAALTKSVFSSLGYTAPNSGTAPLLDGKLAFWSRFVKRAAVPVAVLLLSFTTYLLVSNNSKDEKVPDTSSVTPKNMMASANTNSNEQGPVSKDEIKSSKKIAYISSIDESNLAKINNSDVIAKANNSVFESNVAPTTNLALNIPETNDNVHSSLSLIDISNSNFSLNSTRFSLNQPSFQLLNRANQNDPGKGFIAYAKGFNNTSNAGMVSGSILDNVIIGGFLPYRDDLSFGIEFGQQNYLRFKTDNSNLLMKTAESQSIVWMTIAGKYNFNTLEVSKVVPYAQFGLGGSTLGTMIRANAGIEWKPEFMNLGFTAGYDFSRIWYSLSPDNSSKINFNTDNQGIVFGIFYKF